MNRQQKEYEFCVILAYLRFMAHITAPYEGSLDVQCGDLSFVFTDLAERLERLER